MTVVSLIVSCLALLVSAGSFSWQVVVWRKATAQIVVSHIQEGDWGAEQEEFKIYVVATNVGRGATTINEVGITYFDADRTTGLKMLFAVARGSLAEEVGLPKRLEPGEEFQMSFTPWEDLDDSFADGTVTTVAARGYVRNGLDDVVSLHPVMLRKKSV